MPVTPKKKLLRLCVLAVALALVCWAVFHALLGRQAKPPQVSPQLAGAAEAMDDIQIDALLCPDERSMQVTQVLTLTARGDEPRQELVLRTWANAFQKPDTSPVAGNEDCCPAGFSAGSLVIDEATLHRADGISQPVYRYTDEARTVLSIPLEEAWQPGERLMVTLRYTVHFPHIRYRFGWWEDTFMAGHAFVTPALWQDGAYRTDAWQTLGDPLSGECCNYTISCTVPEGYTCAAGGSVAATVRTEQGVSFIIDAPAVRDPALVMSRTLTSVSQTEDGVLIQAFAPDKGEARRILGWAKSSLKSYGQRWGQYPWPVYTVCALPLGVSGAEYTALSMVGDSLEETAQEYAVAHETAHQWWYALVGSDSQTHPWQDEALCEYSLLCYVGDRYGAAAREELRRTRFENAMRVTVPGSATPGAPLDYFETETDYMVLVYGRAPAFLCAVEELLKGSMDKALAAYADAFAFAIADRQAFADTALTSTGMDIEPLMVDYLDTYLLH